MEPSASFRVVKFRLYLDTKACMAATSERAATPTNVTLGLSAATLLTDGPSALQNGHHGVQNHSTAGLPCNDAPLNGAPLRVVAVKSSRSSASAAGGLVRAGATAGADLQAGLSGRERRRRRPSRSPGTCCCE